MVRVIHYFETQVKAPITTDEENKTRQSRRIEGRNGKTADEQDGTTTQAPRVMKHREILPWFSKILDAVKMRYRKLQTFAR